MTDETNTYPIGRIIDEIERTFTGRTTPAQAELRSKAAQAFAKANGWKVSKTTFSIGQLQRGTKPRRQDENTASMHDRQCYDHIDYFRAGRGIPVGFITHSYAPPEMIAAAAERDGLQCRFLARSWYYPARCTAALLTAPQAGD